MRIRPSFRPRFASLLAASGVVLTACSEGPSGPTGGGLAVLVSGLPSDVNAAVSVSGPGGFARTLSATDTLDNVEPGTYVLTSSKVTSPKGAVFGTTTATQEVAVVKGAVASATVGYAVTTGALRVQVSGLPSGTVPSVEVRGAFSVATVLTSDTTIHGLTPGSYTITAAAVAAGSDQFTSSPREQVLNVMITPEPVAVSVSYALSRTNLRIAAAYITQSVQRMDGSVPLVQARDGLIRVFVTADEQNMLRPAVRVRLFQGTQVVFDQTEVAASNMVPLSPNADLATSSVNMPIDKSLIQPGLSMLVELDPENLIAEGDEGDNRLPAAGTRALDVRVNAPLRVLLVQLQDPNGRLGSIGDPDVLLSQTVNMYPVSGLDVQVRPQPFLISKVLLAPAASVNEGWSPALSELRAARLAEPNPDYASRMWYGLADVEYTSGIAGLGYLGQPAAIGWDKSGNTTHAGSASSVMAHELGHNFGRYHAPCGSVAGSDPSYPYAGGVIGQAGYDISTKQVVASGRADLMGYCNGIWVSDYTYQAVLNFRSTGGFLTQAPVSAAVQPTLLVWGRVSAAGEVTLNPAFEVSTRPALPSRKGSHVVRGLAADGRELFSYAFEPDRVADNPKADGDFAFAVPMDASMRSQLASIVVLGRAGRQARTTSGAPAVLANANVRTERMGAGAARVRWDAGPGSMAMIRDAATGQVLGFARGGSATVRATSAELEVIVSDGVRSRASRVRAAQ